MSDAAPTQAAIRLALVDPLASEPFLILGEAAYRAGDFSRAEALLLEARRRDPRSPASRYLLAGLYLDTNQVHKGLEETAALVRLLPGSASELAPSLARFMRLPGAAGQIAPILRNHPDLAPPLFSELAADPSNADLLVGLAAALPREAAAGRWQARLIDTLLNEGAGGKARSVWAQLNRPASSLAEWPFDATFRDASSRPPFNWEFSSKGGVVERERGRLHALYYGREGVWLARQTVLLPSGDYVLETDIAANEGASNGFAWTLSCRPTGTVIGRMAWPAGATGRLQQVMSVPARDCPAQELRLEAAPGETSGSSDLSITSVRIKPRAR